MNLTGPSATSGGSPFHQQIAITSTLRPMMLAAKAGVFLPGGNRKLAAVSSAMNPTSTQPCHVHGGPQHQP